MQCLPNNTFFKFRPDTLEEVRKEFNLHKPGVMEDLVKNFEEWVQKQPHFTKKDFTKHFLESSIIISKGSLEKAKRNLDRLCTFKTLIPKFFSKHNVAGIAGLKDYFMHMMMPTPTENNYRIYLVKVLSHEVDSRIWLEYYNSLMMMCEYKKANDYTKGFCAVIDIRNVNILSYTMKINVLDLRDIVTIIMEGYSVRVKAIHIISESKSIDALVSVFKQMVSEKIFKRIHVHKTLDSLYQHENKALLPKDYGGNEKDSSELYEEWIDVLNKEENVNYFKNICNARTNEAYRDSAIYNSDILGMPGSFRVLNVD